MNYTAKISLTIAILAIIAGGVWYTQKGAPEAPPADGGTNGQEIDSSGDSVVDGGVQEGGIDTSDWKTYRNEEYGFELSYPNGWFAIEEDDDYTKKKFIIFSNLNKRCTRESCPDNYLAFFVKIYSNSDEKTYSEFTNLKSQHEKIATIKEVINISGNEKIELFVISKENEEFYETLDITKPTANAFFGSDKNSYMFYTSVDIPSGSEGQEIEVDVLRKALDSFKITN